MPNEIALAQSINTDSPSYDIRPLDGPAPHLKNNGIERNGGIRSAYQAVVAKAAYDHAIHTQSGKKVVYNRTAGTLAIDGTAVPSFNASAYAISARAIFPGSPLDVKAYSGHDVLALFQTGESECKIQTWRYGTSGWEYVSTGGTFPVPYVSEHINVRIINANYVLANYGATVRIYSAAGLVATITNSGADYYGWEGDSGCFVVVQMDTPNTWTYRVSTATLTAYAGYGFPGRTSTTIRVYRTPVVGSNVVGLTFSTGAATTPTNITLASASTTAIYKSYRACGALFVCYANGATPISEIIRNQASARRQISYAGVDVNELFGEPWPLIGSYTIGKVESYYGIFQEYTALGLQCGHGAMLSDPGDINNNYFPTLSANASGKYVFIYQTSSGEFASIMLDIEVPIRMALIGPEVVRFNTISGTNIIDVENKKALVGPTCDNGAVAFGFAPGSDVEVVAARSSRKYGGGVDAGEATITATTAGSSAAVYPLTGILPTGDPGIDIFRAGTYYRSAGPYAGPQLYNAFTLYENEAKTGTIYAQDTQLPPPAGAPRDGLGYQLLSTMALGDDVRDMFELADIIPLRGTGFILFGEAYVHDGEYIYSVILGQAGTYSYIKKIAVARGLQFLAATATEAWFLSAWDNSLWSFNGGRNVEKKIRLNALAAVSSAVYCGAANELAILLAGGTDVLYMRDGIITKNTLGTTGTGPLELQPTDGGTWLVSQSGDAGNMARIQYDSTGASAVSLDWQTAYQGQGGYLKHTVQEYALAIYFPAKTAISIGIELHAFDETRQFTAETYTIAIGGASPYQWDAAGVAHISIIPRNGQALATSIRLTCSSAITILDAVQRVGDTTGRAVVQVR